MAFFSEQSESYVSPELAGALTADQDLHRFFEEVVGLDLYQRQQTGESFPLTMRYIAASITPDHLDEPAVHREARVFKLVHRLCNLGVIHAKVGADSRTNVAGDMLPTYDFATKPPLL